VASDPQAALKSFQAKRQFFIGIDSDGCAFDTMEVKHKECFCPACTEVWQLQAVARYAREAWDFVNLYSKERGCNRWLALKRVLDLLRERPEVRARGVRVSEGRAIQAFIDASKVPANAISLSNDGLAKFIAERTKGDETVHAALARIKNDVFGIILGGPERFIESASGDAFVRELLRGLIWSAYVNFTVSHLVHDVPPFPYVRESLVKAAPVADIMVVSATPGEALVREWQEHGIAQYAAVIAGQEMGTKAEHLALCARGKYPGQRILMIGDAPGDLKAARANGALFFPVNPGAEDRSWRRFHDEALDRFVAGAYAGPYEAQLIQEFDALLPAAPPWKT
jgi:phosphoglycolate phosphatase-like HAD superfamily hydrolase